MVRKITLDAIAIHESNQSSNEKIEYRTRIVWLNVVLLLLVHVYAPYGAYLSFTSAKLYTTLYAILVLHPLAVVGVTGGAHRLWSHRSYKAALPLKIILMILQTMAFEGPIYVWARDHRVHHKYSETNADPHNAKRGFFFAHVGWLLCKKHPDVIIKGKGIDIDDLRRDPVVAFQKKYYTYLVGLLWFIVPTAVPVYLWNETWSSAFFIAAILRYVFGLHVTWSVNSVAHLYGQKPYDRTLNAAENKTLTMLTLGEGWHNFHHTFPWDYKTGELGYNRNYNMTTAVIDLFASIGWAYDLKTVSPDDVRQRVKRTGDGTHDVWGWGDKDQTLKERDGAILMHPRYEKEY